MKMDLMNSLGREQSMAEGDHNTFWLEWFGLLGRELGSPSRFYAGIPDDFLAFIDKCAAAKLPCFCSVQPYVGPDRPAGLEKVFFDLDWKKEPLDLDRVWVDVCRLCERLNRMNLEPLVVRTYRGFHVYIYLWRVVEFELKHLNLAKEIYKTLQESLLQGQRYETLDPAVIGDVKRLSRVPYSIHELGVECSPLSLDRQPLRIDSLDYLREHGIQQELFREAVQEVQRKKIGREVLAVFESFKPKRMVPFQKPRGIRPCFLEALKSGEMPHGQRIALVYEGYCAGLTIDETVNLFRRLKDFNEAKTRYQVSWLLKKSWEIKPYRCKTIMAKGWCLKENCSIFHRLKKKENR